ncbi:pseudouridine synthase [Parapedomonas caeni]
MVDARSPRPRPSRPRAAAGRPAGGARATSPEEAPQRIAKLLARAGVGSRRDVERMIAEGRVALGGKTLDTPATLLASLAGVTVDGQPVAAAEPTRMWRFHKPTGCLTTARDPAGRPTIFDLLPPGLPRLLTIGRLDYNTEGLLLLTNDGALKRRFELPANEVERVYRARVRGRLDHVALAELAEGIAIEGVRYGSIIAEVEASQGLTHWLSLKLREGKNREVRNVLGHLGLQVARLIRVRYGDFDLGDMAPGSIEEVPEAQVAWASGQRHHLRAAGNDDKTAGRPGRATSRRGAPEPAPAAVPSRLVVDGHRVRVRRDDEMEPATPEPPVREEGSRGGGRGTRRVAGRRAPAPRQTGARAGEARPDTGAGKGDGGKGSGGRGTGGRRAARGRQRTAEAPSAPERVAGPPRGRSPDITPSARPASDRSARDRPGRPGAAEGKSRAGTPRRAGDGGGTGRAGAGRGQGGEGRRPGGGRPGGGRPGKPRGRRS